MLRYNVLVLLLFLFIACKKQILVSSVKDAVMQDTLHSIDGSEKSDISIIMGEPIGIEELSEPEKDENGDIVCLAAEVMPEYPLGNRALIKYLTVINPEHQGRVSVSFILGKDGSVRKAKVIRSLSEQSDQAALQLIRAMPNWTPGMIAEKPVVVRYTVSVYFVGTKEEAEQIWNRYKLKFK